MARTVVKFINKRDTCLTVAQSPTFQHLTREPAHSCRQRLTLGV